MSVSVLMKARVLIAGREYSAQSKSLSLALANSAPEVTGFGNTWEQVIAGINSGEFSVDAYSDYATAAITNNMFAKLGGTPFDVLIAESGLNGEVAFIFDANLSQASLLGPHGEPEMINFNGKIVGKACQARVLEDGQTIRTGNGTSVNSSQGPFTSDKTMFAMLHVLSGSAGTLDVTVESDVDSGFASPVTQFTFAQIAAASAPTSVLLTAPGVGGSEQVWRAKWTIPSGNWAFVIAFGAL